jgi:transposase
MFCGYRHFKINHKKKFSSGKVYINSAAGFWGYAKERLIKHHGVSKERLSLYLKEMEFHNNNRDSSVFNLLVGYLRNHVANLL